MRVLIAGHKAWAAVAKIGTYSLAFGILGRISRSVALGQITNATNGRGNTR